ncbi:hypothetical protein Ade02nite_15370 [Paractinoplanes deccanensis]|uniref:Uncharacterized protein n=1 Tax=Paractinoplanes deccanensis TaxID=113561 RepID=A0ABQ3XYR4_9ACTN|nr:hypothetical protein Ade02nite_15370 [Actinoplanes deccanensis]
MEEPDVYGSDGAASRRVVDRISAGLGGPAHPGLGIRWAPRNHPREVRERPPVTWANGLS